MIDETAPDAASDPAEAPAPQAPVMAAWQPGRRKALSRDKVKRWKTRSDRADAKRKQFEPQWERALERYAKARYETDRYDINALLDFRHVENKKAQVFPQTPEYRLHPVDPKDQSIPYAEILPLRQKYLNYKLGVHGANAKRAFHQTLVDGMAASGWFVVKIGYEHRTLPVPDPATGKQAIGPDGTPVEIPIWSRCFLSRVSPKKLGVPDDFNDTNFDEAPWLSVKGVMALSQAKQQPHWRIPSVVRGADGRFTGVAQVYKDEAVFQHGLSTESDGDPLLEYEEIWYKASLFDEDVWHPDLYRCLVLVKGLDEPACCMDSPYQTLNPDGTLSDDSLIGNPIHVGTLRDLPDSAYVPCDLVVGEQLSREVNKHRTDLIRRKNQRQPITLVSDKIGQPLAEKIINDRAAVVPAMHLLPGGQQDIVVVVQGASIPRDDFAAQDAAERDWQQGLGSSDARSGQVSKRKVTATEIRSVAGGAAARDETERLRFGEFVLGAVWKYDTVLQRTATPQLLQKVLGTQGAVLWAQWRALPGKYAYGITPDSDVYLDPQQARVQQVDEYNLFRKDDRVNTETLLEKTARVCGYDPATFIAPPQDNKPDPPSTSFSLSLDKATPVPMQVAITMWEQSGFVFPPALKQALLMQAAVTEEIQAVERAQKTQGPGHGGSADRTEPINQHQSERTGGVQGVVQ